MKREGAVAAVVAYAVGPICQRRRGNLQSWSAAVLTIFLAGAMLLGCRLSGSPPPGLPQGKEPIPPERIFSKSAAGNHLKQAIDGSVAVRFHAEAVKREFQPTPGAIGLERLNLKAGEHRILDELDLARVRRAAPWLEVCAGEMIRVQTDAERRQRLKLPPQGLADARAFEGLEREMIFAFPPHHHPESVCRTLRALPSVESCRVRMAAGQLDPVIPNDPAFAYQLGLHNPAAASETQVADFDIDAPEAWEAHKGNPAVVVAVVDDGIQITHPDLYEKIWINIHELPHDFVDQANALSSDGWPGILTFTDLNAFHADDETRVAMANLRSDYGLFDGNANGYIDGEDLYHAFADGEDDDPDQTRGYIDDIVGWDFYNDDPLPFSTGSHGTAVAGLVGASTDNALNVAGVGWNTRIMAVSGVVEGWESIQYALIRNADVVTSSLAPGQNSIILQRTLARLEEVDSVFSAALGNVDRYIDGTFYAQSPYTIAVGNFRSNGVRDHGGGSSFSVNTDVVAPGAGTYSLNIPTGSQSFGGTSGANPIVAGILSLIRAVRPDLKPEQLRQVLRHSAMDVPPVAGDRGENLPGFDYYSGWGLSKAGEALKAATASGTWAEAKLTIPSIDYRGSNRRELFHIMDQNLEITAYAGIPGGGTSQVVVERAPGPPPVPEGAWTTVASSTLPYAADSPIAALQRDDLPSGTNTLRLTVLAGNRMFQDYGRIDVPRAYLDVKDHSLFTGEIHVRGFAFHRDFSRYELQAAAGHAPDENNAERWTTLQACTVQRPPLFIDSEVADHPLGDAIAVSSLPDGHATLRLAVFDRAGSRVDSMSVPIVADSSVFPFQSGFPAPLNYPYRNGGATACDLTGDGKLELIVTHQAAVIAYRADGTIIEGFPAWIGGHLIASSPAVGDITGDGVPEIVVRATERITKQDSLWVISNEGRLVTPWPLSAGTSYPEHIDTPTTDQAPVLADLDGDGDLEILLSGNPADSGTDAGVLAFQADGTLWHRYAPAGATSVLLPPAVGDADGDGQLDLFVVTGHNGLNFLTVWRADGTPMTSAPVPVARGVISAIALADMDADGDLEIVVLNRDRILEAHHHDGPALAGWSMRQPLPGPASCFGMSIADLDPLDNDPRPQVIVSITQWGEEQTAFRLHAVRADGSVLPGWASVPAGKECGIHQPAVFDVDNDGRMEVLVGPAYYWAPQEAAPYFEVRGFNHDATPVVDSRFPIYLSGEQRRAPAIADLDRDGDLEYGVAANSWNGPVEVHDLDSADDPGAVAWGMQLHDPQRTSNYHGGLRIIEPCRTRPSEAGPAGDASGRQAMLIRLRKEIPHGRVDASALTVKLGEMAADIIGFTCVQGEHWLLVATPDQPAAGFYRLQVEWNDGGIRRVARQPQAVRYTETAAPTRQVLVIDRSGSMLEADKFLAARAAANFFVSARIAIDSAGLVSFDTQASDDLPGMLTLGADGSANRLSLAQKINAVTPASTSARTSIGAGLRKALLEVLPPLEPNQKRALVLLSDGLENTAPFWDRGADPVRSLFELPENSDVAVHTIALGPHADRDLHAAIAEATGGTARFVHLGNSLSLFGRLTDAYRQVDEILDREQRLFTRGEEVPLHQTQSYHVTVPESARRISVAVSYRNPGAQIRVKVLNPQGVPVAAVSETHGPSSCVVSVAAPPAGIYHVEVTALKAATEVLTTVSARVHGTLAAALAGIAPEEPGGMRATLLAILFDGKLPAAESAAEKRKPPPPASLATAGVCNVKVRVTAPDKSVVELPLLDDGLQRDGSAGDGVYAAPISFIQGGGYALTVTAEVIREGRTETYEKTLGYFQPRAMDQDLDGIPDRWERRFFGGLALEKINPAFDHDGDGLNALEEHLYQTDPLNSDTDGDGRPDGEEVDAGTDPLRPDPAQITVEDSDGDGIPDVWEKKYFPGNSLAEVRPGGDPDGDRLSNFTEYRLRTHPLRRDSDGNGITDYVQTSWRLPQPSARTWRPQPQNSPTNPADPWWLAAVLFVIGLLVLALYISARGFGANEKPDGLNRGEEDRQ
jgi:subtilisin family serine protease